MSGHLSRGKSEIKPRPLRIAPACLAMDSCRILVPLGVCARCQAVRISKFDTISSIFSSNKTPIRIQVRYRSFRDDYDLVLMEKKSFAKSPSDRENDAPNDRNAPPIKLSSTDQKILEALEANARISVSKLAETLGISSGLVRRRMTHLEEERVIRKYTIVVDHWKIGRRIEAYLLLKIDVKGDLKALIAEIRELEGVREVATLTGDEDVLVRLRVSDPAELTDTVLAIRQKEGVVETKTFVSLGRERFIPKRQNPTARNRTPAAPGAPDDVR
jgi:Lrp/AsnC family leucine-responsive transcriptional regulator